MIFHLFGTFLFHCVLAAAAAAGGTYQTIELFWENEKDGESVCVYVGERETKQRTKLIANFWVFKTANRNAFEKCLPVKKKTHPTTMLDFNPVFGGATESWQWDGYVAALSGF